MAETIDVQVTAKSQAEVAHQLVNFIFQSLKKKKWEQVSRKEYLNAPRGSSRRPTRHPHKVGFTAIGFAGYRKRQYTLIPIAVM